MKTKVSALVDGELETAELGGVIDALDCNPDTRETWHLYHLMSDAMRDTTLGTAGFAQRFAERLASEPTVMAPGRLPGERVRRMALPAAASVAAVALVGWLAFAPVAPDGRPEGASGIPMAEMRPGAFVQPAATHSVVAGAASLAERRGEAGRTIVPVALPQATNDYLIAHQEFSPRVTLQGVAPYVRRVAAPAPGDAR